MAVNNLFKMKNVRAILCKTDMNKEAVSIQDKALRNCMNNLFQDMAGAKIKKAASYFETAC